MSDARERAETQAIDWQMRLHQSPRNPLLRLRHRQWLATAPLHREIWQEVEAMWRLSAELLPVTQARWPGPARPRQRLAALACAASLLLALGLWLGQPGPRPGEALASADGSRIWPAADSRLERHIDAQRRNVVLHRGAAFFDVARDPERPFTVEAGGIQVRVLGTAFAVELREQALQVAVERGRVRVGKEPHWFELGPGQMLQLDPEHLESAHLGNIVGPIAPWRDNLLVARNDTIDALVAKVSSAHGGFIWLRDAGLGQQRVTGLYDLNDPEQALASMVRPHGGKVRRVWPNLLLIESRTGD